MSNDRWFEEALAKYPRIAIAGGPKVGKTTLSNTVSDRPIFHTDEHMSRNWEDVPFIILEQCKPHLRFIVEGVQVPRALRKGLEVDAVLWLDTPLSPLSPRQVSMAKGVLSVFVGWRAQNHKIAQILVPPGWVKRATIGTHAGDK